MEPLKSFSHNLQRFLSSLSGSLIIFFLGKSQENLNEMVRYLTRPDKKTLLNDVLQKASVSCSKREGWQYLNEVSKLDVGW